MDSPYAYSKTVRLLIYWNEGEIRIIARIIIFLTMVLAPLGDNSTPQSNVHATAQ